MIDLPPGNPAGTHIKMVGGGRFAVPKYGTDVRRHTVSLKGELGMVLVTANDTSYVAELAEGGAATRAGIPRGSVLLDINGMRVGRLPAPVVLQRIKEEGKSETTVDCLYPSEFYNPEPTNLKRVRGPRRYYKDNQRAFKFI